MVIFTAGRAGMRVDRGEILTASAAGESSPAKLDHVEHHDAGVMVVIAARLVAS
jgi:hypothetical protein